MLFISDKEWTVLKMVGLGLRIRLQRHRNYGIWEGNVHCTKYNEINICYLHIQKQFIKNDIKSKNITCTGSHKSFPIHCIHAHF